MACSDTINGAAECKCPNLIPVNSHLLFLSSLSKEMNQIYIKWCVYSLVMDCDGPAFRQMAAGIGSSPPATLNWIKQVKKKDGWTDGVFISRPWSGQIDVVWQCLSHPLCLHPFSSLFPVFFSLSVCAPPQAWLAYSAVITNSTHLWLIIVATVALLCSPLLASLPPQ